MFIFRLWQKFKILKRFNRIILTFFGAGFSFFIYRAGLKRSLPVTHQLKNSLNEKGSDLPKKFREVLEKLGPVFVKFGQILSTRSDILPREYITELSKLQATVPPFAFEEAKITIENELGKPLPGIFEDFSALPFASASLGQVYKAKLFSGETVAVKVQRPKAKEQIKLDTAVLLMIAHWLDKNVPEAKGYNVTGLVQEFRRWTLNELDYRKEATNCEIFSNFFKHDPHIYGPQVYWQYSSASVLTLEFVEGVSLGNLISGRKTVDQDRKKIAHLIADSFVRQFFEYGYFHADPHPGNIFILKNHKILFLDFGMVGFLDEKLAGLASSMFLALIQRDIESLVSLLLQVEENYDENIDFQNNHSNARTNALRKDLNQLILQWPTSGAASNYTLLLTEMLNTAVKNGISVPTDLAMLSKAIVTLDVVVKELDPEFDIAKWEQPMVEKILTKKLDVKHLPSKVKTSVLVLEDILKKLPESTATIVGNLEKGRYGSEFSPNQLLEYERMINANSKFNTYGILLAAGLVASALIYQVKGQAEIFGLSTAQIALYGSLILIIIFFISNINKEKHS